MKVILFGATGMVGQGALRECLLDPSVDQVLSVGRTPLENKNPKLKELIHKDLWNYQSVEKELTGYDACFFCLGTSSSGKTETEYSHITYDLAMAAASTLSRLNPQMTFIYISAVGADPSEKGRIMWARVRGKLENALRELPFKAVYILRPGIIVPLHGIKSKTDTYRWLYNATTPLLKVLRLGMPGVITSTEVIGRAILSIAKNGAGKKILENRDFIRL